jgi:hypothetical protein
MGEGSFSRQLPAMWASGRDGVRAGQRARHPAALAGRIVRERRRRTLSRAFDVAQRWRPAALDFLAEADLMSAVGVARSDGGASGGCRRGR